MVVGSELRSSSPMVTSSKLENGPFLCKNSELDPRNLVRRLGGFGSRENWTVFLLSFSRFFICDFS